MPAQIDTKIKYPEYRELSECSGVVIPEADKAGNGGASDNQ
jgi:hypothetical protein